MPPVILWFRQDLRLHDNPALAAAVRSGADILPLYILDDGNAGRWAMGGASRWWLHHSLHKLNESLGGRLACFRGDATIVLKDVIERTGARAVYWNRCYEPWRMTRDAGIKAMVNGMGAAADSFNASLLYEPWTVKKADSTPYRVFTPFFRRGCLESGEPPRPEKTPPPTGFFPFDSMPIDALGLLPRAVRWDRKMEQHWTIGEAGALARMKNFLDEGLRGYKEGRDRPAAPHVSRLSPHLHFGEISPRTLWHAIRQRMAAQGLERDGDHYLSELGWREFSAHLLYHNHDLPLHPLQERFHHFPWDDNPAALTAWQRGETGYPIVDAGMRELWETGYMHNRVRMIVGSFLVKNLLLHWHHGQDWFWDCLVDADLANNAAGWQWIAGCGADAAPYFRIFNPVTQGEKFDPAGDYIRRFIPELAHMPDKFIHKPWDSPVPPAAYPAPIVDLAATRTRALSAFAATKGALSP